MRKSVLQEKAKEMTAHFKMCLSRNTFLRNQGYIDADQFKIIRDRILDDQDKILPAFGECEGVK